MALQNYRSANQGHFPIGTVPNRKLPPDKRLSWLVQIFPSFMIGGYKGLIDKSKSWDSNENCPPRWEPRDCREEKINDIYVFLCPAIETESNASMPAITHYVGVAGIGKHAAELPLGDPAVGFFGYDRKITSNDITDGLSTTIAVVESVDGGPWTAGGPTTVRGIRPDSTIIGEQGQWSARHSETVWSWSNVIAINVGFADGSARPFTPDVSREVCEALATIHGDEIVNAPF